MTRVEEKGKAAREGCFMRRKMEGCLAEGRRGTEQSSELPFRVLVLLSLNLPQDRPCDRSHFPDELWRR